MTGSSGAWDEQFFALAKRALTQHLSYIAHWLMTNYLG